MAAARINIVVPLLVLEAGLAVVATVFYSALTAEYGDVTASALENFRSGLGAGFVTAGIVPGGAIALRGRAVVAALGAGDSAGDPGVDADRHARRHPSGTGQAMETRFGSAPHCLRGLEGGLGPGPDAMREAQRVFDSIEHVGYFSGGASGGVSGCEEGFVVLDDVDVLQHYRTALVDAGWQVIEDDGHRLRAQREGIAFEVVMCDSGHGGVWAGRQHTPLQMRAQSDSGRRIVPVDTTQSTAERAAAEPAAHSGPRESAL